MSYYLSSPDSSSAGSFYEQPMPYAQRPASTSPTLGQAYPGLAKMRYEACRGFDVEDDLEFCPALSPYSPIPAAQVVSQPIPAVYTQFVDETPVVEVRRAVNRVEIINPSTGLPIRR